VAARGGSCGEIAAAYADRWSPTTGIGVEVEPVTRSPRHCSRASAIAFAALRRGAEPRERVLSLTGRELRDQQPARAN